jgi:hemerythrin superfamily protein
VPLIARVGSVQHTEVHNSRLGNREAAMEIFTLLRGDHRAAESIFQKIESRFGEAETPEWHELFRRLKAHLDLHAQVEDLHVYRVFQQGEATRDSTAQALEAHRKIKTLLDELASTRSYDFKWVSKFKELHQIVAQHVATEEQEMFSKGRQVLTFQEAEELGRIVEAAKRDISHGAPTAAGGTPE